MPSKILKWMPSILQFVFGSP